jgi:hypothetical protein
MQMDHLQKKKIIFSCLLACSNQRFNMELDHQSLFRLFRCTAVLIGCDPATVPLLHCILVYYTMKSIIK